MGRGSGWWDEPYRHALAARGISLKSREELDYALHLRGEIYPGEVAQYIWYDTQDNYPGEFNTYKPIPGEIQYLRNIRQMMDIYDRRRHRPLNPNEILILRSLVKDFMRRVKRDDISLETRRSEYEMLDEYLNGEWSENESRSVLFAAETVLYLMHWSGDAIDTYIGRKSDETSTSARVVHEALNLQRGGYGEMPPGEGEILLDLWIQELERRRYT